MTETVPEPGFGTARHEGESCVESVRRALEAGYRHVDTAQMYGNEREVGEAIASADLDREEVFVATKVDSPNLAPADVVESTEASLDRLGLDRVDLLYVHWPFDAYDPAETLPAIDETCERGLTRNVGVSNFTPELLEEAVETLESPILAHQIELHPRLPQHELVELGREHGITTVAYCPLIRGEVTEIDTFVELAERHDATPAQIAMAWFAAKDDVVPIPKATGDHVEENLAGYGIELSSEELERIDALEGGDRLIDPEKAAWNR